MTPSRAATSRQRAAGRASDLPVSLTIATQTPRGEVELVIDEAHLSRVVQQGILKARVSLDIATADFKAMLVPVNPRDRDARSIVQVLRDLTKQGVEIRLLHAGVPSGPALRQLTKELPRGLTIRRCPRLHAKTVIVDCASMYLGSANLTGAGLGAKSKDKRNIEWGIWTTAPSLIDPVLEQFNALWEGHRCKSCKRKEVCPVPLEEPVLV